MDIHHYMVFPVFFFGFEPEGIQHEGDGDFVAMSGFQVFYGLPVPAFLDVDRDNPFNPFFDVASFFKVSVRTVRDKLQVECSRVALLYRFVRGNVKGIQYQGFIDKDAVCFGACAQPFFPEIIVIGVASH